MLTLFKNTLIYTQSWQNSYKIPPRNLFKKLKLGKWKRFNIFFQWQEWRKHLTNECQCGPCICYHPQLNTRQGKHTFCVSRAHNRYEAQVRGCGRGPALGKSCDLRPRYPLRVLQGSVDCKLCLPLGNKAKVFLQVENVGVSCWAKQELLDIQWDALFSRWCGLATLRQREELPACAYYRQQPQRSQ